MKKEIEFIDLIILIKKRVRIKGNVGINRRLYK